MAGEKTIDRFDRLIGNLHDLPDVVRTKPATIVNVTQIVGSTETYIVQTYRHAELGDTIFLQCATGDGNFRIAIPPKVSATILRQHESASGLLRKKIARRLAAERKERGEVPGFMRKKVAAIKKEEAG